MLSAIVLRTTDAPGTEWWASTPPGNPPASIKFSTGAETVPPADWASKKAGQEAARLEARMDVVRLAGSVVLTFEMPGGPCKKSVTLASLLKQR